MDGQTKLLVTIKLLHQVYPDEGHFLDGAKGHLYSSVVNFLKHCLQLELDWSPLQLQSSTLDSATSRSNKFA